MKTNEYSEQLLCLSMIFRKLSDPRYKRGVRHPYHALCALVFVGLLARITEMAVLVRWAKNHWAILRAPLGFVREETPSATCISRSLAKLSLLEFRRAFAEWISLSLQNEDSFKAAAIDGKTCCQGLNENGKPEMVLNVFLHNLKLALSQYSVGDTKSNEPGCLAQCLDELVECYPFLRLLTGDAIYLQRPLLNVLREHGLDYLFQVKDNQRDTVEALDACFSDKHIGKPAVEEVGKKMAEQ